MLLWGSFNKSDAANFIGEDMGVLSQIALVQKQFK